MYLQTWLDIVYRYSFRWKFEVNCKKSNVAVFNNNKKKNAPIKLLLGESYIHEIDSVVHLGIQQDGSLKLTNRISERCQKAKTAFLCNG